MKPRILQCLIVFALANPIAASDWLPLEVGNSWTYSHRYTGILLEGDERPSGMEPPNWFTIKVLRTETIKGQEYFVMSDIPDNWAPVPDQFIAGKKLRWKGNQLMDYTDEGEVVLFEFGEISGARKFKGYTKSAADYSVTSADGSRTLYQATAYIHQSWLRSFVFGGGSDHFIKPEWIDEYLSDPGLLGARLFFLKGFGLKQCAFVFYDEYAHLMFANTQKAFEATIGGNTITIRDAEKAGQANATSTNSNSWGSIKRSQR